MHATHAFTHSHSIMTTVINQTPNGSRDGDSGMGAAVAVVVILLLAILFFVFGLPAIRGNQDADTDINIDLPETDLPGTSGTAE
jgi:hypothetical protein